MEYEVGTLENCPLSTAEQCDGALYLVSQTDPVDVQACKSQAERGRAQNATGDKACMRFGLSVFPNFASCEHHRETFPGLGNHIAVAHLNASHGVQAATPSNRSPEHCTWWPGKHVIRHTLFSVVAEES
jgi:hypothetical protein